MVTVQPQQPPVFFVRGPSPLARLVFFSVLSIVLMAVDSRLHYLNEVRQGFSTLLYPLEVVASSPIRLYHHVSDYFSDQQALNLQNRQLQQQLVRQAAEMQRLRSAQAENEHLRSLLQASQKLGRSVRLAEVIHTGRDPFVHKIEVNLGSQQGVLPGQAVVDGKGVIGQVTRAYPFSSEITLITDKTLVIPVQVLRNGLRAIAFGQGRDGTLYLPYLPANVDIRTGDELMTSGIDGTYPEGMKVAVVQKIEREDDSPFAHIVCLPVAGVEHYRQVLIVTNTGPAIPERLQPEKPTELPGKHHNHASRK
jgi:rod shape-determining protein MreC